MTYSKIINFVKRLFGVSQIKETPEVIIVEPQAPVAETGSQPTISVDVQSDQPVQVEIHVRTQDGETRVTVGSSQYGPCRFGPTADKAFVCDGIETSEELRYHGIFQEATSLTLDGQTLQGTLSSLDLLPDIEDVGFGSENWMSPSAAQVKVYYELRTYCLEHGLNRDGIELPIPESHREFQLAIAGLRRIINGSGSLQAAN